MEKGRGKGTDTLPGDNDYLRRGDVKRLLENVVCLHEELPAQIDLLPAADVVARDCYDRLLAENDELLAAHLWIRTVTENETDSKRQSS